MCRCYVCLFIFCHQKCLKAGHTCALLVHCSEQEFSMVSLALPFTAHLCCAPAFTLRPDMQTLMQDVNYHFSVPCETQKTKPRWFIIRATPSPWYMDALGMHFSTMWHHIWHKLSGDDLCHTTWAPTSGAVKPLLHLSYFYNSYSPPSHPHTGM